jgi:hypothetical protein
MFDAIQQQRQRNDQIDGAFAEFQMFPWLLATTPKSLSLPCCHRIGAYGSNHNSTIIVAITWVPWEPLFFIYLHDDNEPTAASSLHDSMPDLGSARSNIRRPLNSTRGIRRAIKKSDDNEPTAASSLHDSMPSLGSRTRSIARLRSAGSTIRRPLSTPRVSHCAITNSDDNEPTAASSCMYLFLLVLFGTFLFCVPAYNKTIHEFASGFTVTC